MTSSAIPSGDVVICGVGARTSVGLDALQTTMGIRAEVFRPVKTAFVDPKGALVGMCCVGALGPELLGADRLMAIARRPLQEAAKGWLRAENAKRGSASPIPLVIAVPEGVVKCSQLRTQSGFLEAIDPLLPGLIDVARSVEVIGGRAAGVSAFQKGIELLNSGVPAVLVGGVDSYYDANRVAALAQKFRLHGLETENGICPGEAAAFVLLTKRGQNAALPHYASILGYAMELEPRPFGGEEPRHGIGMSAALRTACEVVGKTGRIGWQITDVMDERHRVDEWAYARSRANEFFTPDAVHEQPLTTVGEVGAASAALFVVVASVRWQTHCGFSDAAIVAVHSDGPERGAMLLAGERN